jgi:hypothetical protein
MKPLKAQVNNLAWGKVFDSIYYKIDNSIWNQVYRNVWNKVYIGIRVGNSVWDSILSKIDFKRETSGNETII